LLDTTTKQGRIVGFGLDSQIIFKAASFQGDVRGLRSLFTNHQILVSLVLKESCFTTSPIYNPSKGDRGTVSPPALDFSYLGTKISKLVWPIAPDFVVPMCNLPEVGSTRFFWLPEPLCLVELEAAS
jgi:hypothetical protein